MLFGIYKVLDHFDIVYFITGRAISNRLGLQRHKVTEEKGELLNESMNDEGVCKAL